MIVCAGNGEEFEFATSIGVGLVESAINLSKILSKIQVLPNEIIFIGSYGLYEKGNILDIIEVNSAVNLEVSVILGKSYSPVKIDVSCETNLINSSNFITIDKKVASEFAKLGLIGENMEFYSVLKTAESFGISAQGILCATNFCDANAHENYLKNREFAKEKLTKYLAERKII